MERAIREMAAGRASLAVDLLAVLLGACEGARRVGEGQGRRVA